MITKFKVNTFNRKTDFFFFQNQHSKNYNNMQPFPFFLLEH